MVAVQTCEHLLLVEKKLRKLPVVVDCGRVIREVDQRYTEHMFVVSLPVICTGTC